MVIVGGAGAGKSVLTRQIVVHSAQEQVARGQVDRLSGAGFLPPSKMSPSEVAFLAIPIFLEI